MNINQSLPHHRNHRLFEFDYSQPGAYFVTIVAQERKTLFGQIVDGKMVLNNIGKMVNEVWIAIPDHFPNVELGVFVVMPNHFHGIVSILADKHNEPDVGARHAVPQEHGPIENFGKPVSGSVATIIRSFKSATTKAFHEFPGHSDDRLWQQGYYDRVIRNEREYEALYDYILANPMNWEKDEEFFSE
ncbi:MAG: transposase [Anaerolineaceae bacterium]|nr:transposase [Anaerolineaceae bacterium]